MRVKITSGVRYGLALLSATIISVGLLGIAFIADHGSAPGYLLWNLFLAWIPFGLATWLVRVLRRKAWSSWEGLVVSGVWLAFLPNSFYMVSDFIHLSELGTEHLLFYAVLFTLFIFTALALGISSLYLVHTELRRRIMGPAAWGWVLVILFVCSVAIYIGRDLRWNTWDVLVDPSGLLFDLSSRLLHPAAYGQIIGVIAPFFVLLSSMYGLVWCSRKVAT